MQLAWYRTRGEFTATYETALTRLFKHGRTETIRTLTPDARAWVLAMLNPECPVRLPFCPHPRLALRQSRLTHARSPQPAPSSLSAR